MEVLSCNSQPGGADTWVDTWPHETDRDQVMGPGHPKGCEGLPGDRVPRLYVCWG